MRPERGQECVSECRPTAVVLRCDAQDTRALGAPTVPETLRQLQGAPTCVQPTLRAVAADGLPFQNRFQFDSLVAR